MKIALLSDLHFEFHSDNGEKFINSLDPHDADVLVLAGDIGTISHLETPLKLLCAKYPKVIMVYGNHHFYGSNRENVVDFTQQLEREIENFYLLDNDVLEIEGQRFLGTPLWFAPVHSNLEEGWSDFRCIRGFKNWVYEENAKAIKFLTDEMKSGDVIITHYLPSFKSVDKKFENDPSNCFFVCDVEELIKKKKPKLWLLGHTHMAHFYQINNTKVFCNPYGYQCRDELTNFNPNLIIET